MHESEERHEAEVGFAIKSDLVGMPFRLPLSGDKHTTTFSAYAPVMTNSDEVEDNSMMNDLKVAFDDRRVDRISVQTN